MSSNTSHRTCPSCGATNSSFSLFCAECGASLEAPEADDTATYRPVPDARDDQETAAFTPTAPPRAPEPETVPDTSQATRTAPPIQSTVQPYAPGWDAEPGPQTAPDTGWAEPSADHRALTNRAQPESMRGFFLGLVAVLLIGAVLGAWIWAGVLTDGARDSLRGFFGFIG
jgi:hypothetical protein